MSCESFYERLADHQDGLLSGDDCAAVDAHLLTCQDCHGLRTDLEALSRLCREGREQTVMPPGLRQRIQSLLQEA